MTLARKLTIALPAIVAVGAVITVEHRTATKERQEIASFRALAVQHQAQLVTQYEKRRDAIRRLALDDLRRECEEMRSRAHRNLDLDGGLQIILYEMNVSSAIGGRLDEDASNTLSLSMQGPLSQEVKLRVMADAAERLRKAERIYDEAQELRNAAR